ncbi:hypothetical protein ABT143_24445 [Streptomyces sp. NPDC002033]|uniref:hypothetical protein n=1 Tax=unclassified Streptomyces TaxID=2593676 RepID=UPI00331B42FF
MSALVRLYPAAFRREFGDEIAYTYREATRGAGRRVRILEAGGVVGHALRLRLGLGSAGRPGKLVAAVAPFALVSVAAASMSWARMGWWVVTGGGFAIGDPFSQLLAAQLVTVLGAFLALAGRWAAGTWTMAAGVVAAMVADGFRPGGDPVGSVLLFNGPLLALALAALICPPDLRPAPRTRTRTGTVAVLVWAAVVAGAVVALPPSALPPGLKFAGPLALGVVLAGRQAFARLRTAPAVLLAGLPLVFLGVIPGGVAPSLLTGALGLLLVAAVAVSVRRRRAGRNPALDQLGGL